MTHTSPPRGHDPLLEHLGRMRPFTAVVVGDFMLDEMVYGRAERLSADAPVPVLQIERETSNPGGAANLCLDLVAMRAAVRAVGVIGDDAAGRKLTDHFTTAGVDPAGLVTEAQRPTTVKRNYIGLAQARHPQKMFRADAESRTPLADNAIDRILAAVERAMQDADVVCIEDYNKGVCTDRVCQGVIELATARGIQVLVDPAAITDYTRYRGATSITPNRTEAERATGMPTHDSGDAQHNAALAQRLLSTLELQTVVLTLDRHGALLLEQDRNPLPVPTVARDVYDVTGAGDMMIAALAAARANGIAWPEAVRFANAAAGLEVEVFGCVPIPLERIHAELLRHAATERGKLRTPAEARIEADAARAAGGKVVFTNGCFDVIHAGHIDLLQRAASLGDFLVIGLNDDDSVRRLKGPSRPVNTQHDRAAVLSGVAGVGAVVLFGNEHDDTPLELIEAVRPDILVKGADYTIDRVVGADLVQQWGGRVELVPLVQGRSTTGTIQKMQAGTGANA